MNSKLLKIALLIVTGFFLQNGANAQMYISPNSYVFANNEVVFIKQQLELNAANSNFYLRKDAQLVQGSTSAGANKGLGSLSVFQEGTTNNFQFDYWCSPVGGSNATAGNTAFGITQLKDIVNLTNSNNSTPLAMNNYNGTASPFAIAPYWIFKLTATSSYSDWIQVGATSGVNAGEGFTMKGSSGTNLTTVNGVQNNPGGKQRYDFRGKPNDGTISIPVAFEQFTLTGNPYPSAIDLSAFLIAQTHCTGIAYFWEQDGTVDSHYIANYKGGYGAFSPGDITTNGIYVPATFYSYDGSGNEGSASGTGGSYERRFSPIGQGFMIDGLVNGTVEMKNSYRVFVKEDVLNYSQFEKNINSNKTKTTSTYMSDIPSVSGFDYKTVSTAPTPQIRFNTLLNNQGIRQIVLAFIPGATDGVDRAMDAISSSDDSPADVYFVIDDEEYLINAVNFDIDKKIPIGFKNTDQANFKITVKGMLNFTGTNAVYLHDKKTDLYHDIKNDFYDLTLPAGVNNTQFEITFKNNTTLGFDETSRQSLVVYQNNTTKNLTISNPLLVDLASCNLYDVAGKLIFNKKDLGSNPSYTFSTSGLSDGIYIVKIATKDKNEVGQKIIIRK
ncbi:T9SS type A sorting domain-containing protein [Flavobacterium ranwuense]|uniref:T9SS type A sorting domain-containing protein n=1 Tax=Flavobacterium ranwuense TaxID=2541725 RepID=A0ABY2DX28_9FLAO|nr:T9SS type A sorting domain-containing protein [Flavobacterium ranwuense]TDE29792.1 T9SS type A sorting domain-containing protein [Flavobacterium ranwuense]